MEARRKRIVASAVVASHFFRQTICVDDSSDSENESTNMVRGGLLRLRDYGEKPARITNYVEHTIERFSDEQFRQNFRITRGAFVMLENRLGPLLVPANEVGRPRIKVRKQLLSSLWLLATPDSYRSMGERFDLAKSSLNHCFQRVVSALNEIADQVIVWPTDHAATVTANKFQRLGQLPGVIGAIDGTHIEIKAPNVDARFYITRKKRFAITLQAVCDADLRFTDCFAGYAGSVGDLRIFRNSDLWMEVRENKAVFFPAEEYIIGDKAYPVLSWCIPPYRDLGNMTPSQILLNTLHARTRQTIERCFSLYKGRFRRLKYLDMNRDHEIPYVILACCVLHNLCLDDPNDDIEDFIAEGQRRAADVGAIRLPNDENVNEVDGLEKRNRIAAALMAQRQ